MMLLLVASLSYLLSVSLADYTIEKDWNVFSLSNRIDLALQWEDSEETYYVKFPCSDSIWFKLFLNGDGHQNSHIELFSKSSGNIYCNKAGSSSWYDGERTDFYIDNEWQCEDDGEHMILEVEKTREHVTLKNRGSTLYSQSFGGYDGNCAEPTVSVTTQVWNYDGQLSLAFNFLDTDKTIADEWCKVQGKELQEYTNNERVAMEELDAAKAACGAMAECSGLTTESDVFTLRKGTVLVEFDSATSYLPGPCCSWKKMENIKFKGPLTQAKGEMQKAKTECLEREDCVGITCKSPKLCSLARSTKSKSDSNYDSYIVSCRI